MGDLMIRCHLRQTTQPRRTRVVSPARCLAVPSTRGVHLWVAAVCLWLSAAAGAQLVQADWLAEADAAIDAARKTDVRVIVLDAAGRPVPGAAVTVRQERSAFAWGVAMPEDGPATIGADQPVLRHLNAVTLEPVTRWERIQPIAASPPTLTVATQLADQARRQGLAVRWGPVIASDPGRNPGWLADLPPADAVNAMDRIVRDAMVASRASVEAVDLYADEQNESAFAGAAMGPAVVRQLYEQASAVTPSVRRAVRFEDALLGGRQRQLVQSVTALREAFVPLDEVAIGQVVLSKVNRTPVQRAMEAIGALGYDVVIARLEVGGASEAAAALNLETVLRVLFAERSIRGIYFAGLHADVLATPHAALLDENGEPTLAGQVVENLLGQAWRTDLQTTTGELGNARLRVFAGSHRFEATLPNGDTASTTVWIDRSPDERIILLQASSATR